VILGHKIHVLTKKEELDTVRLPGKVVVVLDVLFATSTMVTALAHGASAVLPVPDEGAARAAAAASEPGSYVVAGELYAETIAGFAPPTPLALLGHGLARRRLIYSTTNGTVTIHACAAAEDVYCGALLNGAALVERIVTAHRDQTVLLVCSGSMNNFNLEDFYGAGYLVDLLAERLGEQADFSDAARAARAIFRHADPEPSLLGCRVGKMMAGRGLEHEVRYAARLSALDVVPRLQGGELVAG
jgi:2-phosphosulfolactate phosphatase